jgi:hypothetical protein
MKEILAEKTGYEWSLEANHRILDLHKFTLEYGEVGVSGEGAYFEKKINIFEYRAAINYLDIKENSTPRKTNNYLEWRMYGFVPYNISSIQSGIQFGHGVVEYSQHVLGLGNIEDNYNNWARKDKTFIILNGGTTNENKNSKFYGTMQQYRDLLLVNEILIAQFYESDLNDTLSAICFLVDERVWNRTLYPDYVNVPFPWNGRKNYDPSEREIEKWKEDNEKHKEAWIEKIGGIKNEFLRNFLRDKKLAN